MAVVADVVAGVRRACWLPKKIELPEWWPVECLPIAAAGSIVVAVVRLLLLQKSIFQFELFRNSHRCFRHSKASVAGIDYSDAAAVVDRMLAAAEPSEPEEQQPPMPSFVVVVHRH